MKKLVLVMWSVGIEVDLPPDVNVETIDAETANSLKLQAFQEIRAKEIKASRGEIVDIIDVPPDRSIGDEDSNFGR